MSNHADELVLRFIERKARQEADNQHQPHAGG